MARVISLTIARLLTRVFLVTLAITMPFCAVGFRVPSEPITWTHGLPFIFLSLLLPLERRRHISPYHHLFGTITAGVSVMILELWLYYELWDYRTNYSGGGVHFGMGAAYAMVIAWSIPIIIYGYKMGIYLATPRSK